jgi:hypothetical protein
LHLLLHPLLLELQNQALGLLLQLNPVAECIAMKLHNGLMRLLVPSQLFPHHVLLHLLIMLKDRMSRLLLELLFLLIQVLSDGLLPLRQLRVKGLPIGLLLLLDGSWIWHAISLRSRLSWCA